MISICEKSVQLTMTKCLSIVMRNSGRTDIRMKLDAIDIRILEAVQGDGRITKLALAQKVGLSPTPCWLRLRKLEKAGLITGYTAHLAARRLAPLARVMVEITLDTHRQVDFDSFDSAVAALHQNNP